MLGGYVGRLLRVNLSSGQIEAQPLEETVLRAFIGGSGLGAKLLYEETQGDTDPLGPDNPLIILTGPLTGTRVPTSCRHQVVTKSPATGIFGEADCGGTWGAALRRAAYDGILVQGQADRPVYIWASDEKVEIRDAAHLWGQDTYQVHDRLRAETSPRAEIVCIGLAGEKLVRFAAIMNDGREGRAAARCGVGAVMGAKKLKAIVADGRHRTRLARPEVLAQSVKKWVPVIQEGAMGMHKYGTPGATSPAEALGDLPIKNWVQGSWKEGATAINGRTMAETILSGRYACLTCPIACGRQVKVTEGPFAPVEGAGPEYEAVAALGAMNLIDNLPAISQANELCNRYGLDVISAGAAVSFAFEAYEKGLITKADTGGLDLRWGNPQAMIGLLRQIGEAQGLGAVLGQGVRAAARQLGRGAEEFALEVKGLELPMHDPRAYNSLAVSYATSNRGACHLQALTHPVERVIPQPELGYATMPDRFAVEGKGELTAKMQNFMCLVDSLKVCKFLLFGKVTISPMLEWFNAVTGWAFTLEEFLQAGERIFNLKRLYNLRAGVTRADDTLPKRILTLKRGEGGAAENLPPLEPMLAEYYRYRGWTPEGVPTPAKLGELGLQQYIR